MEGNGRVPPPPPPPPLSFYFYDRPNQPFHHIILGSSFPVTISVCNGVKLFFTITNHSVSITSPNNNAPRLHHLINNPRREAQDEIIILPDQNNNNAAQDNDLNQEQEEHEEVDFVRTQFHGLVLPRLPALPSYIHITSNNQTFTLLVTVSNTIHVINQAMPIHPPHNNDGNCHVINQRISTPLSMGIYFNRDDNTFIDIRIVILNNNTIIMAKSFIGNTHWAALLDSHRT